MLTLVNWEDMMTPLVKPIAYHNIDGLRFGEYGLRKSLQLRQEYPIDFTGCWLCISWSS